MKAIKIDVIKKEVYEVELTQGSLEDIYKELTCRVFSMPYEHSNKDGLYVDDEGLLTDELIGGFAYRHFPHQPLFGHGLIVGCDEAGESDDVKTTVEEVKKDVVFIPIDFLKDCQHDLLNDPYKITVI